MSRFLATLNRLASCLMIYRVQYVGKYLSIHEML